jgi:hypothetical protein
MKEVIAEEKLRIIDVIKENAGMVISIGGFIFLIFQFLILPMYKLQLQVQNILDNHLATIQLELTEAKTERDLQGKQLTALSEQIVRLSTLMETKTSQ